MNTVVWMKRDEEVLCFEALCVTGLQLNPTVFGLVTLTLKHKYKDLCCVVLCCVCVQVAGLQRCVVEMETEEHQRREMLQELDQMHRRTTPQLEEAPEDAAGQTHELTTQASHAASKVTSLDQQLGVCDAQQRGLEHCWHQLAFKHESRRRSPSPRKHHLQGKVSSVWQTDLSVPCV